MAEKATVNIALLGRVFFQFEIEICTGLHIGGSDAGLSIGGVDKTVIRNPVNGQPYIPGSSLRGKIRSLLEKYSGAPQNNSIGKDVKIHVAQTKQQYEQYLICQLFGVPSKRDTTEDERSADQPQEQEAKEKFYVPNRLIVRDVPLSEASVEELESLRVRTDLPFTEVKTEVAIDRVTAAASPRQMERVPAGVSFDQAEIIYSVYRITETKANQTVELDGQFDKEEARLKFLLTGLQLLEDDYLGGLGSRGSGRVALKNITVKVKAVKNGYTSEQVEPCYEELAKLVEKGTLDSLLQQIQEKLGV